MRLRKKIGLFLWFAVGIFVAFIFFEWGMQFAGARAPTELEEGVIGEVDGLPISTVVYNNLVRSYLQFGFTEDEAADSAFNALVRETILNRFYEKAGLFPSDEEIINVIRTNPPPEILADTMFFTDGEFDFMKYREILQNPQNIRFFIQYEMQLRDALPRQRLSTYLLSTVHPAYMINEYLKGNTVFTAEYGKIRMEDIRVEWTEQDLQAYYEREKALFRTPPSHLVQFIKFPLSPSIEDIRLLEEKAGDIMSQLKSGVSFDTLALRFSDDIETRGNFGYVGFVKRGELTEELDEAAFSLREGEVSEPIKSEEGLYILKCISITRDSVEISKILLSLIPSFETRSEVMEKALLFYELAKEEGFEKTAEGMNLEIDSTKENRIDGIDLSRFIRDAEMGKISRPISRRDGIYVFSYEGEIPEQIPPFSDIREEVKERYLFIRREEIARERLQNVKNRVDKGETFADAVERYGLSYNEVREFAIKAPPENLLGQPAFHGALWAMREGDISGPVIGREFGHIIKCLRREEPDTEQMEEEFRDFQVEFWREARERVFDEWLKSQIANAEIKDFRF